MEARQGRNPAGGSMRSTTARPAISQVAGDAQPSKPKKQQNQDEHTQGIVDLLRMRSGRSGAAGSAVFEGRQACAAGIARRAFPWSASAARSAAGAKVSAPGAARRKVRRSRRNDAPKAARRDQLAAGAVIDCNCSITPGSTNTQACSSAIGTLNIRANTVRRRWASRPVRYAYSGFMRPPACEPLRCGSHSTSATKPSSASF